MNRLRTRTSRWTRSNPRRADAALAALVLVLDLFLSSEQLTPAVLGYAALGSVALVWRRRSPLSVLAVVLLHMGGAVLIVDGYRPELGVLLALGTVGAHLPLRSGLLALAGAYASSVPIIVLDELTRPLPPDDTPADVVFMVVVAQLFLTATAWAVGRWARVSRRTLRVNEELAELRRQESLRTDRATIARELHDVVSSAVTVMILQSHRAELLVGEDPDRAGEALGHVRRAGTEAMSELRQMLGVLRSDEDQVPASGTTIGAAVPAVVARVRAVGVQVVEYRLGEPRALERSTELAAVRVIQEALGNTARHGGPGTTATVGLTWESDTLLVSISDDGAGTPDEAAAGLSAGLGLTGLRERVGVVNGRIEWRRSRAGGFRVEAVLPVDGAPAEPADTVPAPRSAGRLPT